MFSLPASAYALIAANLLPLAMAAGGGWGIREILPLYWAESGIIGFFNIFKILTASGALTSGTSGNLEKLKQEQLLAKVPPRALSLMKIGGRIFLAGFFTVHFGGFMAGHAVFLFGLVLGGFSGGAEVSWQAAMYGVRWGVLALFLSHGTSFFLNYVGNGEYRTANPAECMFQPYSRIVVMHLTILFGAFASMLFKNTGPVMVIFVALKIYTDTRAHLKERRKAAPPAPAAQAAL